MTKQDEINLAKKIDKAMNYKYGLQSIMPKYSIDDLKSELEQMIIDFKFSLESNMTQLGTIVAKKDTLEELNGVTRDKAGLLLKDMDLGFVTNDSDETKNGLYIRYGTEWIQMSVSASGSNIEEDEPVSDDELEETNEG